MPHPQPVATLKSGMAERYEVVIDFSKYQIGQRVVLENMSPKNNIDHDTTGMVMAFDVVSEASDLSNNEVPFDLNPNMNVMGLTEADSMRTRHFDFERSGGNWTINGTTWDDVVNSDYQHVLANPGLNDCEIWELENRPAAGFTRSTSTSSTSRSSTATARPRSTTRRAPRTSSTSARTSSCA